MDFSIDAVTRRKLLQGTTALMGVIAAARVGHAANSGEKEAELVVNRMVDNILQLIQHDTQDSRHEQQLMEAIESQTDLSLLARMTVGRYWRRATPRQQEVFVDLFRTYLLRSFSTRLRRYAGADLSVARRRFKILTTQPVGKKDVIVRSKVAPPSGPSLNVDWRLRHRNGRPVIIDLVVEGVSLLITQRSEFGSVMERVGIDGLIGQMQDRVAAQL